MFRGPSFIVSTMQDETTPIFKRLWYDWTQQQPGFEPTNPLGQCWVPPIVAFYDQQGLLRTYLSPGGSIRSLHPVSPWGKLFKEAAVDHYRLVYRQLMGDTEYHLVDLFDYILDTIPHTGQLFTLAAYKDRTNFYYSNMRLYLVEAGFCLFVPPPRIPTLAACTLFPCLECDFLMFSSMFCPRAVKWVRKRLLMLPLYFA